VFWLFCVFENIENIIKNSAFIQNSIILRWVLAILLVKNIEIEIKNS
jgi:hypothetical protein